MSTTSFPQTWAARILTAPPLIAPARQFVYPQHIPGEEDAMNRGALLLDVKPAASPNFLATCALGFREISLPTGIFACPHPDHLLALAGGYAYLIDTQSPRPLRPSSPPPRHPDPPCPCRRLILLAGFHNVLALDANGFAGNPRASAGKASPSPHTDAQHLHGTGWNMHTDREVPFTVDLLTGEHTGGGFTP